MCEIMQNLINEERVNSAKAFIEAGLTTFEKLKESGLYTPEELAAISAP